MAPTKWLFEADEETGIPVVTLTGNLALDALRELLTSIFNTSWYRDGERCLWDLRGASGCLPAVAIRFLAASVKQATRPPQRTAIVVGKDVHFGLARMFATYCEQPGVTRRVFRDYEQAQDWLLSTTPSVVQDPMWYLTAWRGPAH